MSTALATKIGPDAHGLRMSLAEFDHAEVEAGHFYELGRGEIVVSEVANPWHAIVINAVRTVLAEHFRLKPRAFNLVAGSGECKIMAWGLESERHPDLAVYLTPPPLEDSEVWSVWIPDLVVEVVSRGSAHRDHVEKREEYLAFGVKEYWIIDPAQKQMLALQRRGGQWRETVLKAGDRCPCFVLPGLEIDAGPLLAAGQGAN